MILSKLASSAAYCISRNVMRFVLFTEWKGR